eukprot:s1524_g7.t1
MVLGCRNGHTQMSSIVQLHVLSIFAKDHPQQRTDLPFDGYGKVMQLSKNELRRRLEAEGHRPQSARSERRSLATSTARRETPRPENPSQLQVADAQRLIESVCGKRSELRGDSRRQSLQSAASLPPVETQARLPLLEEFDEFQESGSGSVSRRSSREDRNLPPFDVFLEILRGASLENRAEVTEVLGQEFVYVRKVFGPNGPYELELMPFCEVQLESYTTLSPAGLSHYVNGVPVSFVPLQRWLNERESYRALRKLRFFQDFPAQKAFISWRSAGRRGRMAKAGKAVEERVFQLHLWFCKTYLTMRRMFQDFANVRVLRSYFAQPQTLAEFQVAQENWQHDLFQRAAQQAQKVKSEVFGMFVQVVESVRRETRRTDFTLATLGKSTGVHPVPGIIRAGMPKDDSDALETLGFAKDVSFPQRSQLRFECARLLRFARFVDLLIAETLVELMQLSVVEITFNIRERPPKEAKIQGLPASDEGWHGHLIFKVKGDLSLNEDQKCFTWNLTPDAATLFGEFMRWLRNGCGLANFFVQLATCPELEAYRYIMRSGASVKNYSDWQPALVSELDRKLFESLIAQEAWQQSTGRLAKTLEKAFEDVQTRFKQYDSHLQWCYKCQHTDIRELVQSLWNSAELGKLNQMLHDYREGLLSLDQIPSKHSVRPLEVEISGAIAELKASGTRCLAELEEELPEILFRCADHVSHWISNKSSQLTEVPSSLAEFVSDLIVLQDVKLEVSKQSDFLDRLADLAIILDDHRHQRASQEG